MDRLPPLPKSLTISLEQHMAAEREHTDKYRYETTDGRNSEAHDEELDSAQQSRQRSTAADNESSWRLDEKMSELRQEMSDLRRMDMSLLSQLNALRDTIVNYKRVFNIDNNNTSGGVDDDDDNCDYQNYMPYRSNTIAGVSYSRYARSNHNNEHNSDDSNEDDVDDDIGNENASDLSDEREDTTESSHSTV